MSDDVDDGLDELLRAHLRSELDGGAGKVASNVAGSIRREERAFTSKSPHPGPPPEYRERGKGRGGRRWWVWVAGAMAASIGIVWGVAVRQEVKVRPRIVTERTATSASAAPVAVVSVVQNAFADEGTFNLQESGPVRRVRQRTLETTTFYDPVAHATLEVSVPSERVTLVELHSY